MYKNSESYKDGKRKLITPGFQQDGCRKISLGPFRILPLTRFPRFGMRSRSKLNRAGLYLLFSRLKMFKNVFPNSKQCFLLFYKHTTTFRDRSKFSGYVGRVLEKNLSGNKSSPPFLVGEKSPPPYSYFLPKKVLVP